MSQKVYKLVTACIGVVEAIGVALVTYFSPEYTAAINASIVIVGTAVLEVCNQFVTAE